MDYMLLIYCDESRISTQYEDPATGAEPACHRMVAHLKSTGQYRAGDRLKPTSTATSLQIRDGQKVVTDGPFAETREQLAGYVLFEAADLDDAIRIAAMHPVAEFGTVEIRPVMNYPFPDPVKEAEVEAVR